MRYAPLLTRTCTFLLGLALAPCGADERFSRLVHELGNESWNRRETAQVQLLENGVVAASLLEAAARSANPELAYRAKYILSRLDPRQMYCQVIKVVLAPEPRVASIAQASGQEGEELLARPSGWVPEAAGLTGGYLEDPSYAIRYRSLEAEVSEPIEDGAGDETLEAPAPAHLEVAVVQQSAQPSQGVGNLEMPPVILGGNALGLLRAGDQSLLTRRGFHLSRRRYPFVTLLRLKSGRKSQTGEISLPSDPATACAELGKELATACVHPQEAQRHAALEALSWLRSPQASPQLEQVLVSSGTSAEEKALACLGLDRLDSLQLLLPEPNPDQRPESPDQRPGLPDQRPGLPDQRPGWTDEVPDRLRARAVARCLEKGDEAGLPEALQRVAEGNPNCLHGLMSAIADFALSGKSSPQARQRIAEAAFSEEVLGRSVWQDVETEHFLHVAAGLIESDDLATLTNALGAITALAKGELGPVNTSLRPMVDIWRKLHGKLSTEAGRELQFWLAVLPTLKEPSQLLEAVSLLEPTLAERCFASPAGLEDQELEGLFDSLLAVERSGDAQLFSATVQALTRIIRVLCIRQGQLESVVEAFVEAGELGLALESSASGQTSTYLRQLEAELGKWTDKDEAKRKSNGEAFNKELWRAWLGDAEALATSERAILESGGHLSLIRTRSAAGQAVARATPRPVVYYELEFELQGTARLGDGAEPYRILDARRVELSTSRQSVAVDRWGNRTQIRVEDEVNPGKQALPRFRVNSRTYLFAGVPLLTTVQSKSLSSTWYETSDPWFGSRGLPGGGSPTYRSLYLVDYLDADPGPPPASDPESLWRWLVEKKILVPPPNAAREHWVGLFGVLRTLRLRASIPILRQELERQPSAELAQLLLELGDKSGEAHLQRALEAGKTPQERFQAALALTETGSGGGALALVTLAESNTPQLGTQGYRILGAFESFLAKVPTSSPTRTRILGLIVSKLEDHTYQHRGFTILEREAGRDFGFTAAQTLNQPQEMRQQAITRAIALARAWWAGR